MCLGEWKIFVGLDAGSFPGQFELRIRFQEQLACTLYAVRNLLAAGFADLAAHLAVAS